MESTDQNCQYVWAEDDPEPSAAPIDDCASTDDCKSGETCCEFEYVNNDEGVSFAGMKVGCLADSSICLGEYELADIPEPTPPEPDVPTYPLCETKDDCMGLKFPEHTCCVI